VDCAPSGGDVVAALASGASATCHATWTLVQGDVDAGGLTSTATATTTNPSGGGSLSDTAVASVVVPRLNGLSVTVSLIGRDDVDASGKDSAGDRLRYSVPARNTGTTTLTGVAIDDPLTGGGLSCGTLLPGATCTLSTRWTLMPADLGRGSVTNTATAMGTGPDPAPVSATDSRTTALEVAAPTPTDPGPTDPGPTDPGPTDPGPTVTGYAVSGIIWFDVDHNGRRDSGEPVLPGATVTLDPVTRNPAAVRAAATAPSAVTGPDGHYLFTDVAPGAYTVVAHASATGLPASWDTDGNTDWRVALTVIDADAEADFASTGAGSVAGTVVDRGTGAAIAGAGVACTWPGLDGVAGTADDVIFSATSAADGTFTVAGAPLGHLTCDARDTRTGDHQVFTADVTGTEPARAEVELGQPPAGVTTTPRGTLPVTGDDPRRALAVALTLVAAGLTLLGLGSRRRRA
jgi:hypothetical protein